MHQETPPPHSKANIMDSLGAQTSSQGWVSSSCSELCSHHHLSIEKKRTQEKEVQRAIEYSVLDDKQIPTHQEEEGVDHT